VAEVFHRYLRRGEPVPQRDADVDALKAKKLAADLQFVEEKKLQTIARRRETEIRNARAKRELIPREHASRQAAFLVISLRQRLLALSNDLSREIAESCDCDQRAIASLIDAHVRVALDDFANLPVCVSDPNWMKKVVDDE
jgi:hypothetical protein